VGGNSEKKHGGYEMMSNRVHRDEFDSMREVELRIVFDEGL
jgi:hypothetical protein